MFELVQIGKRAPNFITIRVYQNRVGKIRLFDIHSLVSKRSHGRLEQLNYP